MAKYAAKGVTISVNAVIIPGVRTLGETTGGDRERIDATTHDTTGISREHILGFKSGESVTFTIAWDPSLSAHTGLVSLLAGATSVPVVITWPVTPAYKATFNARVSAMPLPSADINGLLERSVTLEIDGAVTEAAVV